MSNVIELNSYRGHAYYASPAKCLACNHEWMAVSPVGVIDLECPECSATRGVTLNCLVPESKCFRCNCGNWHFSITKNGAFCHGCGLTHGWNVFVDEG